MAKNKKDNTDRKSKVKENATNIVTGEWLSSGFFGKHKFAVLLTMAMLLLYISYKYQYKTRMREISSLKTELAKAQSEGIRQKSLYRSNIRETEMLKRVNEADLDLRMQPKPPYTLKYEE